jgi:hypothetical protein
VHRSSDTQQLEFRKVERSPPGSYGFKASTVTQNRPIAVTFEVTTEVKADLSGGDGAMGAELGWGNLRRMEKVPSHREALARTLAAGDSVLCHACGVTEMVYTTNPVESLHPSLRKAIRTRGAFPAKKQRAS